MAKEIDIFNPVISKVPAGLEGKVVLIYGSNNLGKTRQMMKADKPLFLQIEQAGLNALRGVKYIPINKWKDIKQVIKQLLKDPEATKQAYQTIVVDEVEGFGKLCMEFIANKHGVKTVKEGNKGYGLWQEYETEVWNVIKQLVSKELGLTLVFIAHETEVEKSFNNETYSQKYPKADKRTIAPIVDQSNIVGHVYPRVDENNHAIPSGIQLEENTIAFARSHFRGVPPVIEPFSYKALEKAITEAILEEAGGVEEAIDYKQQAELNETDNLDFDSLKKEIVTLGTGLAKNGKKAEIKKIMELYLPANTKTADLEEKHVQSMALIVDDFKDLVEE